MTTAFNKANVFDLSHEHLLTCNMGKLYPVACMEVIPGDTFSVQSDMFLRLEAMLAPAMHRIDAYMHWFYVPNRILMDDWEKYITGGFDGDDTTVKPYMVSPSNGYEVGSLQDYFGIPTGIGNLKHSALPIRAYQKIMNDWYVDENNMEMKQISTASGKDEITDITLATRCWEKDYFTSSLPSPQRGPSAMLPLSNSAPVIGTGMSLGLTDGTTNYGTGYFINDAFNGLSPTTDDYGKTVATSGSNGAHAPSYSIIGVTQDPTKSGLVADLSTASAVSVNQMRLAFQVQKFMETNMRGGARLVEWTLSHFGVRIPDGRLQRSEYLGGGRSPVVISPVEQNSSTDSTTPQGNLAGRGSSAQRSIKFKKSFVEQGWIIGLLSIMPRTTYSQGLARMWSRETRYDEYVPVFAHLGEQEVRLKELYATGTDSDNDIFAYNDRYSELRRIPSSVHGQFRPGQSLDYWTLTRKFDSPPQLSAEFVQANPSKRIFAVTDEAVDCIECEILHNVKAIRPLPKYGNPGLIDHS